MPRSVAAGDVDLVVAYAMTADHSEILAAIHQSRVDRARRPDHQGVGVDDLAMQDIWFEGRRHPEFARLAESALIPSSRIVVNDKMIGRGPMTFARGWDGDQGRMRSAEFDDLARSSRPGYHIKAPAGRLPVARESFPPLPLGEGRGKVRRRATNGS